MTNSSDRTRLTGQLQLPQIQPSAFHICRGLNSFEPMSLGRQGFPRPIYQQGTEVMNTPLQATWVRFSVLYAVSLALIGCMRQSTQRVEPAGSVNQPTTHIDSTNRLVSHPLDIYQPGIAQYDYQSISTIQLMANDSTSRIDSSRITAVLTTTFAPVFGRQTAEVTVKADSILIVTQPL